MTSDKVLVLNELNFDAAIDGSERPVLVDFTAAWCGPCRAQSAILHAFAENADVLVATVDVDDCPDLAARFGVRGMPTLLAFRGGKEIGRRLGLASERTISALVSLPSRTSKSATTDTVAAG
jgi:thioredoxin 1